MTTATGSMNNAAARCVHQLRFARGGLMRVLEGFPSDKITLLPEFKDGGAVANHALWIAGHLATTDDWFLQQMGVSAELELCSSWHETFGGGSKPVDHASTYPAYSDVLESLKTQRDRLIAWFSARSEAELAAPSPEKWSKYAPTVADFAFFLAWHEGYHAGQLSVVRKQVGLGPAFG